MIINEERRQDLEYKDMKTKVEVVLRGQDSAAITKLVKKYEEWDMEYQRARALRQEVSDIAHSAEELKTSYENELRDCENRYFDIALDSAKTKVIRTMQFVVKISATPKSHESSDTDWEAAFNSLAEVLNAPIEVVEECIKKHTEVELVTPKAKLYRPETVVDKDTIKESVADTWFGKLLNKLKLFYNNLLQKLKVFDNIMDRLEQQYL